jgi:hypothetical protein
MDSDFREWEFQSDKFAQNYQYSGRDKIEDSPSQEFIKLIDSFGT